MADALEITLRAKDETKAAFASLGGSLNIVKDGFSGLTGIIGGTVGALGKIGLAAQGIKTLTSVVSGLTGPLTKGNAQFEDYGVQFTTLIKNSDDFKNKFAGVTDQVQLQALATQAAKDKMAEMAKFGATTPFDLPGVVESQRVLMGFGLAADNAKQRFGQAGSDILRIAGDVSSGTGTDFKEIALDIGKFSAGATGEAISRFQELGITTRTELTKMGLQFDKGGALIVKNQEDMDHATSILLSVMKNKYGGLMDAQSATFNGMMSNAQDWVDGTIRTLSAPLFEPAKKALKSFLDFTSSPAGQQAVTTLAGYIQGGVDTISNIFEKAKGPVGEFAGKIFELYQTFSPLSAAIDIFKGVMTGGLEGGLAALEKRVVGIGKAFGVDLAPAMQTFDTFVTQTLIPTALDLGKTFVNDVLPKIGDAVKWAGDRFSDLWRILDKDVFPVAKTVIGWLGDKGSELFKSISSTLEKSVFPAISKFGEWLGGWLWPKMQDVFGWIGKNVGPIFDKGFSILTETVIPTLGDLVNIVTTKVIPTLGDWWGVIATFLQPVLESVGGFIMNTLLPRIGDIWKIIQEKVLPTFATFADFVDKNVLPVLKGIAGFLGGTLGTAFNIIGSIIGGVIDVIGRLAGAAGAVFKGDWGGALDALTGKNVALSSSVSGLEQKNKDLFTQLDTVGKNSYTGQGSAVDALSKILNDNKTATGDVTKANDDLVQLLKNQSAKAFTDAQDKVKDLGQKYKDGKISADQFKDGVQGIQDKLKIYNDTLVLKKDFIANFGTFEAGLDSVIKKLGQVAEKMVMPPMQWQTVGPDGKIINSNTPPQPVRDYPVGGVYRPGGSVVPAMAMGSSSFGGGPVLWGDAGMEKLTIPGGPTLYASGPVYSPDMTSGSKFTPARDMRATDTLPPVNIYLTVHGQPDQAQLIRMKKIGKEAAKEYMKEVKNAAQHIRSSRRPQRST